jgi:hypothetical protein
MNLNVTDLRTKLRRTTTDQQPSAKDDERRKVSDRRVLPTEPSEIKDNTQRIWLTPGERTLIEDLYLLEDNNEGC